MKLITLMEINWIIQLKIWNGYQVSIISREAHANGLINYAKLAKALSKPVLQYTLDGTFIAEYPSITHASSTVNVTRTSITRACYGRYKSSAGFIWRFKITTWISYYII